VQAHEQNGALLTHRQPSGLSPARAACVNRSYSLRIRQVYI
jgi:hypothetical protein